MRAIYRLIRRLVIPEIVYEADELPTVHPLQLAFRADLWLHGSTVTHRVANDLLSL